jgi:hypothetical protein
MGGPNPMGGANPRPNMMVRKNFYFIIFPGYAIKLANSSNGDEHESKYEQQNGTKSKYGRRWSSSLICEPFPKPLITAI